MPSIGPLELIIILVIVLLIFGAGRLASIGSALGKSIRDFKQAVRGEEGEEPPEAEGAEEEAPRE